MDRIGKFADACDARVYIIVGSYPNRHTNTLILKGPSESSGQLANAEMRRVRRTFRGRAVLLAPTMRLLSFGEALPRALSPQQIAETPRGAIYRPLRARSTKGAL